MTKPTGSVPTSALRGLARVDAIFAGLRGSGRKGLMPFICAGDPSLESSIAALAEAERAGAHICEVGIPFSDPIADGPVIAGAMHRALEGGVTPGAVLDAIAEVRGRLGIGLIAMVSVSIVHRLGGAGFVTRCAEAGIDGFIFPDAPMHEAGELTEAASGAGCSASLLIAPSTPIERCVAIAEASSGFVYVLARSGITGEQGGGPAEALAERVAALRGVTDLPLAVGFGIASAEQVRTVVRGADADAAIVGSALVEQMASAGGEGAAASAGRFVAELAKGLD